MELLTLRWSQVDLQRQTLILEHTKYGEVRAAPLTGLAAVSTRERFQHRMPEHTSRIGRSLHVMAHGTAASLLQEMQHWFCMTTRIR